MARGLPAGAGLSLKVEHYASVQSSRSIPAFFEVHAENYLGVGRPAHRMLEWVRERTALSVHGVGLSIGGESPPCSEHLDRVAALIRRYEPAMFSEHLAWSSHGGVFYNDLLPISYDERSLQRVCTHVMTVQERLNRTILLENPATYVELCSSTMSETQFLAEVLKRTGCGLLLDVSNVVVSCTNQGRAPEDYLAGLPLERVGQIHLAGYAEEMDADGAALLIDTHDRAVPDRVWTLYEALLSLMGPMATLIEWDNALPDYATLEGQAARAERILRSVREPPAQAA
jgi:uncharacterized protein (UPF0276 family)